MVCHDFLVSNYKGQGIFDLFDLRTLLTCDLNQLRFDGIFKYKLGRVFQNWRRCDKCVEDSLAYVVDKYNSEHNLFDCRRRCKSFNMKSESISLFKIDCCKSLWALLENDWLLFDLVIFSRWKHNLHFFSDSQLVKSNNLGACVQLKGMFFNELLQIFHKFIIDLT